MVDFEKRKNEARQTINQFVEEIRDYRMAHGYVYTEYLVYCLQMEEYHRGVWNTLKEIERELS